MDERKVMREAPPFHNLRYLLFITLPDWHGRNTVKSNKRADRADRALHFSNHEIHPPNRRSPA